jgi:hypothetical protein
MNAADKGSRRRATERAGIRLDASVVAPVVVVLLAAAAVLLTLPPSTPGLTGTGATTAGALVDHTAFACPDQDPGKRVDAAVRLGLVPATAGQQPSAGGSVRQGPVSSGGRPVDVARGRLVDVPGTGGPAVDATGGAAAGLFGFRTDVEKDRTLGVTSCAAPRSQWWFTGAGAGLDHSSSLLLTNLDPGPAVVDIRVLGPDGRVDTVATTGLTIPPRSVKRIDLSSVAPQTDELALSVHAGRGRVVAAVTDAFSARPSEQPGQEWLAGTDLPSRTLRLAGLPATADSSTLLVANPSDLEAVVDVQVAGRSGSFAPTGLDPITVAPGSVEQVDLGRLLPKKEAVALRLRSRVPVVASVRSTDGADQAYAEPVGPLVGPAVAPLVRGAGASVQLTAGAVATKVGVATYTASGKRVESHTLAVGATATQVWSPKRSADYVVVTPSAEGRAGTVHGAVVYSGSGLASVPLTALPLRVERPTVRPGLR